MKQQDDDFRRNVARRVYPLVAEMKKIKLFPKTFGLSNSPVFNGFFEIAETMIVNTAIIEFDMVKYTDNEEKIIEYFDQNGTPIMEKKEYIYPDNTKVIRVLVDIKALK